MTREINQPSTDTVSSHNMRDTERIIAAGKVLAESMDFEEMESVMWRKHQLRRFFQDRGQWWTNSRRTTAWKWVLVITTGIAIGIMGYFVYFFTDVLMNFKFNTATDFINNDDWASAFFSFIFISLFFAFLSGVLCWIEPAAAGSGIPEIKAYLNGINLNKVVRIRVLFSKVFGMCLSVAAGLPLGKEGPMIHSGSIVGAAVSQGKTITFGFDTSWTKFQDLRNDRSKRDFVTFGAAAGVAAAFSAPIGGILFTLEEGASFWSTTLTFRAFFCALMTELTLSLLYNGFRLGEHNSNSLFAFGIFDDFQGYSTYELLIFAAMGAGGGIMGSFFNLINKKVTVFRSSYAHETWKRMLELLLLTFVMALISFLFPLMWDICTPVPTNTADWTSQELDILDDLVQFQCEDNYYNQVASLFFVPSDTAMQLLYHLKEVDGTTYTTFDTGALLIFFIPYYFLAAITSGTLCPAGLFVPTLLAGAAYGRIVGHILNCAVPGFVTDAGSYALIGAAALLGGMSRMTIAGTIIILEACGNSAYLLPLMITFAASRYSGNAINDPMYDMHIHLKQLPFLEGSLKTLGLLNYHPIVELMAQPVVTLNEINKVSTIHRILSTKSHNGFPVVDKNGHLKGFILRKTLCTIMKLKAFSTPLSDPTNKTTLQLSQPATVFYDTIERNYPHYPKIEEINLDLNEMNFWLDIRPYMDTAPFTINGSASLQRCYRLFRTMGLRHLVVLDNDHRVIGIVTRKDINEMRLEHHWFQEGDNMQKFINIDPVEPGMVPENVSLLDYDNALLSEKDVHLDEADDKSFADPSKGQGQTSVAVDTLQPLDGISQAYRPPRDQKALKEPKSIRK